MNSWDYETGSVGELSAEERLSSSEEYRDLDVFFATQQEADFAQAVQFDLKMLRDQIRNLEMKLFWLRMTLLSGVIIYSLFAGRH